MVFEVAVRAPRLGFFVLAERAPLEAKSIAIHKNIDSKAFFTLCVFETVLVISQFKYKLRRIQKVVHFKVVGSKPFEHVRNLVIVSTVHHVAHGVLVILHFKQGINPSLHLGKRFSHQA